MTGVCSGPHAGLVRKLGAESVIDYTRTDFTRAGRSLRRDLRRGREEFVHPLPPGAATRRRVPDHGPLPRDHGPDAVDGALSVRRKAVVAFTGLRSAALKRQDLLVLRELAEKS